ncbi:hypothetical protein C0991_010867 [Blastosporella zonata]|nr:hypothetical protein C0991_010867 [Blastosporella zonata]
MTLNVHADELKQDSPAATPQTLMVNTFKRDNKAAGGTAIRNIKSVSISPETLNDALDGFAESAKVAIEVLSEVAKIHPFIQGSKAAVTAFQLVITLELKRRENNAKVLAVKVEMKSMMAVLLQLQNIKDPGEFHPDEGLEKLLADIADYIKEAASMCDWYTKKSTLRKYLKSYIYEGRLAECADRFVEYATKIQQALSIHITLGIDTANAKLDTHGAQLSDIQHQMREILILLDSPREREIRDLIESSGGARASISDNRVLQTLVDKSDEDAAWISGHGLQKLRKSLFSELSEDVEKALEQNMLLFQGKLDIQLREIAFAVARQGDRIIAFFSGGHERIADRHIREMWKEMGWKSTVKARYFVLALRDFYIGGPHTEKTVSSRDRPQRALTLTDPLPGNSYPVNATSITGSDAWATAYVNITYLQAISEAIDDDGSGFVNITEIHKLRNKVRPDNLFILDDYLDDCSFHRLELLLQSPNTEAVTIAPELAKLRDEFCALEEEKLKNNLEKVSYNIDSPSTVSLITGPGRIERVMTACYVVDIKAYKLFYSTSIP